MPREFIDESVRLTAFDIIAVGYLWRGYALLMLGRYAEVCELLKQVPDYFNKYKRSGCDVWEVYEPALIKALLPLAEFKVKPSREGRENAREGLEAFIGSFREYKFRLGGYLYYFHLKEMFPEVYSERETPGYSPAEQQLIAADRKNFSPVDATGNNGLGVVFVSDVDRCFLTPFGSQADLLGYVDRVAKLKKYPLLASLLDFFGVEETAGLEPEPVIAECERLLKDPAADDWLRIKTAHVLETAHEAAGEGTGLILYYDPEIDLAQYKDFQ